MGKLWTVTKNTFWKWWSLGALYWRLAITLGNKCLTDWFWGNFKDPLQGNNFHVGVGKEVLWCCDNEGGCRWASGQLDLTPAGRIMSFFLLMPITLLGTHWKRIGEKLNWLQKHFSKILPSPRRNWHLSNILWVLNTLHPLFHLIFILWSRYYLIPILQVRCWGSESLSDLFNIT